MLLPLAPHAMVADVNNRSLLLILRAHTWLLHMHTCAAAWLPQQPPLTSRLLLRLAVPRPDLPRLPPRCRPRSLPPRGASQPPMEAQRACCCCSRCCWWRCWCAAASWWAPCLHTAQTDTHNSAELRALLNRHGQQQLDLSFESPIISGRGASCLKCAAHCTGALACKQAAANSSRKQQRHTAPQ